MIRIKKLYAFTGHHTCFVPGYLKYDEYVWCPAPRICGTL